MANNKPKLETCQEMKKKTKIYSGGFELIDSNSVLYYDSAAPLELEIALTSYFKVRIKIINDKDDTNKHNLKVNVNTEENIIEYRCYNFDNSLGTGTSKPIELCTVEGKKVYIHFWIYTMGKNSISRKIDYSIWKEK